jgi:hypothetical protein
MDVEFVKSRRCEESTQGTMARLDRAGGTLARLQLALDGLRARMAEPEPTERPMARMAALLAAAAVAPPGSPGFAAAAANATLSQRFGPLDLPSADAPLITLVLSAANPSEAMATLHALAPLLNDAAGEVMLANDTADPGMALLPTLVRGLRVIGGDHGQSCNLAVSAARAPTVMLLDAAPRRLAVPLPEEVWLGPGALDALDRFGVRLGPPVHAIPGLRLAVSRASWEAAGGLDGEMDDGHGLDLADLCLKLRLLGAKLVPIAGHAAPRGTALTERHLAAHARFRARWGAF